MNPDDDELSALIREHATRHAAPNTLRGSLRAQLALADVAHSAAPAAKPARRGAPWLVFGWRQATAGFALGIACTLLAPVLWQHVGPGEPFEDRLVAEHVRALRSGPLFEVASSDRHTVKPWFQGRIDYAPPVHDFGADGFALLGARVERFDGQPLATLVYARDRHMIDLVIAPRDAAAAAPRALVRRGFNVLHWSDGAMAYWAVSDVERAELERFQRRWAREAAGR